MSFILELLVNKLHRTLPHLQPRDSKSPRSADHIRLQYNASLENGHQNYDMFKKIENLE